MVERLDPSNLAAESHVDIAGYIESDFRIRSGLCPNGCGLMHEDSFGQECRTCSFSCNVLAEKGTPS